MLPDETGSCPAAHVVFRLIDAEALLSPHEDVLGTVLGGREVEPSPPPHYPAAVSDVCASGCRACLTLPGWSSLL